MGLRVCEVPHRDIMKSKVQFEWNASLSPPERPVMKVLACKEGMQVEQLFPRVATDVYPIYVCLFSLLSLFCVGIWISILLRNYAICE